MTVELKQEEVRVVTWSERTAKKERETRRTDEENIAWERGKGVSLDSRLVALDEGGNSHPRGEESSLEGRGVGRFGSEF